MKVLTKSWLQKCEQVKFINRLVERRDGYKELQKESRKQFNNQVRGDQELFELVLSSNLVDELYQAKLDRGKKLVSSLIKEIGGKIKDAEILELGFSSKEDKAILTVYAEKMLKEIEERARQANKESEQVCKQLPKEFDFDNLQGGVVYKEYVDGNNYYISVDGGVICVENYVIVEREDFEICGIDFDNPMSSCTLLSAIELHSVNCNCFELHMLLSNRDRLENQTHWFFTLRGSNIFVHK